MLNLYNGDCLEKLKDLSDNSIDLLFCDLPYGQTACKWDICIDLELFWKQIKRIRKKGCPLFFTTTTKFGVDLINSNRKEFKYDLIWAKSASTGFLLARKMPLRKHEMIYVFYDKVPTYDLSSHIPKPKEISKELYEAKLGKVYAHKKKEEGVYYRPKKETSISYDPPLPHSIIEIKTTRGKHSTEKPVEVMKWILKYYSKEGDVVLDPTMGSGSTGVACHQMNRKFIGIEKDIDIFKKAEDRLKKEFGLKIETE